jgi:hypothetical protein
MTRRLGLPKATNVNPCHYYLWGTVKEFMVTVHILHKNWNIILKSELVIFPNILFVTKLFKCKENADKTMEVTQYILLYTDMYIVKWRYRNTNFSKKFLRQVEWWKWLCENKQMENVSTCSSFTFSVVKSPLELAALEAESYQINTTLKRWDIFPHVTPF